MEFSIKELIRIGATTLEMASCTSPKLDAELLLGSILDKDRSYFYMYPEKVI